MFPVLNTVLTVLNTVLAVLKYCTLLYSLYKSTVLRELKLIFACTHKCSNMSKFLYITVYICIIQLCYLRNCLLLNWKVCKNFVRKWHLFLTFGQEDLIFWWKTRSKSYFSLVLKNQLGVTCTNVSIITEEVKLGFSSRFKAGS